MFNDPVYGDRFFGRQQVYETIVKRAVALKSGYRQNVAIIGHQQLGKTSILRHFLHTYRDPDTLIIYVEIKLQALDYFIDQFLRSLLIQYLNGHERAQLTDSLETLVERVADRIPRTAASIRDIAGRLRHRDPEKAYSTLFELTTLIREESGKKCVVILDEFHRLGEFGIKNAFTDFGKRIMFQKDTMYLLSSSSFSASRRILAEKLSLLFGNFERIYLEPFGFEESFDFLEHKLAGIRLPDPLRYFLVAFTDGHPFFLDTLTARIREVASVKGETELSRDTIAEALGRLLFDSQGVWNQYFLKALAPWTSSSARGSHLLILTAMAKGRNKLKDIASAINRSQKEASRQIQELMEHELILKTGVFYRFHNKIFKFWLREVYETKELSLLGSTGDPERFCRMIQEMIDGYEAALALEPAERISRLFRQFRNEIVEFGEKRRQLPHFTELIQTPSGSAARGSSRKIIAKGHGRCWVCQVVEEKVTEREILDLVQGSSETDKPSVTKVVVALSGLEDNAKLLAKEKRVLTLGLSRVNMLMDLYGRSPIVKRQEPADGARKPAS